MLLVALLLILAALALGGYLLAGSRARLDGQMRAAGLGGDVSISRDARGSVTIDGANRNDVSWALGFVQAQERFFEMDLMRRVAAGELAELVGPAALDTDLNHRRHRLRAVAEAAYAQLPPEQKRLLDRYRDGVNAGLTDLREKPWEFFLLGTQPRPWRSEDCFLIIAAMYFDLNGDGRNQRELHIGQLRSVLPKALVDFLLAPDPDWEAPLTGSLSRLPVLPNASVFDLRDATPATDTTALAAALAPALRDERPGSNNFAVAGSLTDTGAAMLANDMHLGLRVPKIWFRARLRYPDPTAPNGRRGGIGVTLPGTPALIAGSNGQLAWASPTASATGRTGCACGAIPLIPRATRCPMAGPRSNAMPSPSTSTARAIVCSPSRTRAGVRSWTRTPTARRWRWRGSATARMRTTWA